MPQLENPNDPKGDLPQPGQSGGGKGKGKGGGQDKDCPPGHLRHPVTGECVPITEGGGGDGGGWSSSGGWSGWSSGGGGGGSAPPPDPTIRAMESLYFELWGEPPAPGYVERLRNAGMNVHEFELHERKKPAFWKNWRSRVAEEEATSLLTALARFMGAKV